MNMNFNQQKIVFVTGFEGGTFKDDSGSNKEWGRIFIGQSLSSEGSGGFTVMRAAADKPVLETLRTVKEFPVQIIAEVSQRAAADGSVKERFITARIAQAAGK